MAGVTDLAFRTICRELGAAYTITEMVSAKALCYQDKKTLPLMELGPEEHPGGVQIFGSDLACMEEGAAIIREVAHPDIIDINMGCPVPKVANNGDGSGLLRDLDKACRVAEAVIRGAQGTPVTVKMRLGWDKGNIVCLDLAKMLESVGVAAITLHGRTKVQMYSGTANWDYIREVKQALSIPVIANGDVFSGQDAARILRYTGADGVMIARGVFGNPWIFQQAQAALRGEPIPPLPPWPSGATPPCGSSSWPPKTRGRRSPAWRPASTTPGTSRGSPTPGTGRAKSPKSPLWPTSTGSPPASSGSCGMGAAMDDQRLVALAQEGNPDAFSLLVERHQTMVYNLALGKTGSPQDAEEVTQTAFLKAWQGLPAFQGKAAFSSWLYRLTVNAAIDLLRQRSRRPQTLSLDDPDLPPVPDPAEDPQAQAEAQERRRQLWQAIDALPEVHRTPFLLREMEGYSYREIAKALGLEEGTVKSRLARARVLLRSELLSHGNFWGREASKETKGKGGDLE